MIQESIIFMRMKKSVLNKYYIVEAEQMDNTLPLSSWILVVLQIT